MSDRTAQPLKIDIKLHFSFQVLCSVKKCIWCPTKVCEKCGLLPALMATALVFWPKNALYARWLEMWNHGIDACINTPFQVSWTNSPALPSGLPLVFSWFMLCGTLYLCHDIHCIVDAGTDSTLPVLFGFLKWLDRIVWYCFYKYVLILEIPRCTTGSQVNASYTMLWLYW